MLVNLFKYILNQVFLRDRGLRIGPVRFWACTFQAGTVQKKRPTCRVWPVRQARSIEAATGPEPCHAGRPECSSLPSRSHTRRRPLPFLFSAPAILAHPTLPVAHHLATAHTRTSLACARKCKLPHSLAKHHSLASALTSPSPRPSM